MGAFEIGGSLMERRAFVTACPRAGSPSLASDDGTDQPFGNCRNQPDTDPQAGAAILVRSKSAVGDALAGICLKYVN
jgi:hypothetical protein